MKRSLLLTVLLILCCAAIASACPQGSAEHDATKQRLNDCYDRAVLLAEAIGYDDSHPAFSWIKGAYYDLLAARDLLYAGDCAGANDLIDDAHEKLDVAESLIE